MKKTIILLAVLCLVACGNGLDEPEPLSIENKRSEYMAIFREADCVAEWPATITCYNAPLWGPE